MMTRLSRLAGVALCLCLPLLPASAALAQSGAAMSDMASVWRLTLIDGAEVAAEVTLDLTEEGRIAGQGPCNRYSGPNQSALPELRIGPMISTRMACPEMALEAAYFSALSAVTGAVLGKDDLLVLTADDGRSLVFRRAPE